MFTLIFFLVWRSVATVHGYVLAYAPTNIAIRYLRTQCGLKWAIPAAVVAVPGYLYLAWLMTVLIDRGASSWVLLVAFICFINACKFGALALLVPFLLFRPSKDARLVGDGVFAHGIRIHGPIPSRTRP